MEIFTVYSEWVFIEITRTILKKSKTFPNSTYDKLNDGETKFKGSN